MKFVPNNINDFYDKNISEDTLFQGDILASEQLGLKEEGTDFSPNFWMIITKNCDLVISPEHNSTRKGNISIIPVIKLAILSMLHERYLKKYVIAPFKKIVIIPLIDIFSNPSINKRRIDDILSDKISKFSYLPPDGNILTNPHVLDFDIVKQLDGSDSEILNLIFKSKKLQLASPFREKIAQKFAYHYSSIGINDDEIRSNQYRDLIKSEFK